MPDRVPIVLVSFGFLHLETDHQGRPVLPEADRVEDVRDRLHEPAATRDILDLDGHHRPGRMTLGRRLTSSPGSDRSQLR